MRQATTVQLRNPRTIGACPHGAEGRLTAAGSVLIAINKQRDVGEDRGAVPQPHDRGRLLMGWARIDDGFDDHPKVLALLEEDDGPAAVGLWMIALLRVSPTRGRVVPIELPGQLAGKDAVRLVDALCKVGLWEPVESGWAFCGEGELFQYGPLEGTRDHIPQVLRDRVMTRDGYRCLACGAKDHLTLDHIIPWSHGGPDTYENLRTLCRWCNSSRGNRVEEKGAA